MQRQHLPHQLEAQFIWEGLILRNSELVYQHIKQISGSKFQCTEVPIDVANFNKTANQALYPNANYVPDEDEIYGIPTVASVYIIDTDEPQSMESKPDQEAYVHLWAQADGCMGIGITLEDDDFKPVLDKEALKRVLTLVVQNVKTQNQ